MFGKRRQSVSDATNRTAESEMPREVSSPRRRHSRGGWGPFSGGQLTAIILGIVIAIAFPVGAFAVVSGSNSFITDAVSGKHASVNVSGQLSSAVTGSVTATPTPPNASYHSGLVILLDETSVGCGAGPTVPTGKALVVTSVTASAAATTGPLTLQVGAGTPGNPCSIDNNVGLAIAPIGSNGAGVVTAVFPTGFVVKAGHTVDANINSVSGDASGAATVDGYLVPSTQCTVTWSFSSPFGCF